MSREQSAIIKGVAILLMLIYHLACIPGIQGLNNVFHHTLASASHPINFFLIVSGYGLYYAYQHGRMSFKYLFRRTMKLYIAFWVVLLIFVFGLGSWLYPDEFSLSWDKVLLNFIGWRWDYCVFTWFLFPYVLMSLSSKCIFQVIDYLGNMKSLLIGIFIYLFTSFLISRYFDSWLQWHSVVYHVVLWAQTLLGLTVGSVMARVSLSGNSLLWNKLEGKNLLVILLLIVLFAVRGQIHSAALNPFHASIVVWLVLHLKFNDVPKRIFVELGDKSMLMWFAQGFLGVVMFSEYILLLKSPLLIWIVWVIVCCLVACLLKPVVNTLVRTFKLS